MKTVSQLNYGTNQRGFCPVCLNYCYHVKMREGGRQFGFKHVEDRDLAIYGEVVWDRAGVVYWHMAIESDYDMTDSEVLSHFLDDMKYMLSRGIPRKVKKESPEKFEVEYPVDGDQTMNHSLSVTLPNGEIQTRDSSMRYTHVVVCLFDSVRWSVVQWNTNELYAREYIADSPFRGQEHQIIEVTEIGSPIGAHVIVNRSNYEHVVGEIISINHRYVDSNVRVHFPDMNATHLLSMSQLIETTQPVGVYSSREDALGEFIYVDPAVVESEIRDKDVLSGYICIGEDTFPLDPAKIQAAKESNDHVMRLFGHDVEDTYANITLNGLPAQLIARNAPFPIVTALSPFGRISYEYSWSAIAVVMSKGGNFKG